MKGAEVFPTTSGKVKQLLAARFCQPEWAVFFEVAETTGGGTRSADAIAMNLWRSRGLTLSGFEVKVSRQDFLNELRQPAKAEAFARHVDFWWMVAAKGIVREGELPQAWGLIEVDGRGLIIKRQAPKLHSPDEPPVLTRKFMAALMRRCGQMDEASRREMVAKETETIRASEKRLAEMQFDSSRRSHEALREQVAAFEKSSGFSISSGWSAGERMGAAVALVDKLKLAESFGGLHGLRSTLERGAKDAQRFADAIAEAMPTLPAETEEAA